MIGRVNNMPKSHAALSRRTLLSGLAVSAAASIGVGSASAAGQPQESQKLLSLSDQLEPISAEHDAAKSDYDRMISAARRVWPRAPDDAKFFGAGSEPEVFIDGSSYAGAPGVLTDAAMDLHAEGQMREINRLIAGGGPRQAMRAERMTKLLTDFEKRRDPARIYWAEVARIRRELDFERLKKRYRSAEVALRQHVHSIMTTREETLMGVVIKAQALESWSRACPFRKGFNEFASDWSDEIAGAITRQASQ
ncbi:hypothetical protein [Gymnodinialimonas sp.]